jgi:hypothetical protein
MEPFLAFTLYGFEKSLIYLYAFITAWVIADAILKD